MTSTINGTKLVLIMVLLKSTFSVQNSMICHSHDDLGWLKTIDQYYNDAVRNIFNSVLESLEVSNPDSPNKRKFVYSETGFLKMYIEEDPEKRQLKIDRIKNLLKKGQWEFVNGECPSPMRPLLTLRTSLTTTMLG
jgi:alpha-mannosidase